ncbi:hypothetical protein T06_8969 [Trichinella sp. T6]|nr:hypothetical protein T06_8969 [Trichinella sp. T6]
MGGGGDGGRVNQSEWAVEGMAGGGWRAGKPI